MKQFSNPNPVNISQFYMVALHIYVVRAIFNWGGEDMPYELATIRSIENKEIES